jgi:hypothetical protein
MESWQLQGAHCCGITRGLYRECSGGAHEVAFTLKMSPSDFCVNEVSIKGVVADISAVPPSDDIALPDLSVDPELGSLEPIPLDEHGSEPLLSSADAPFETPSATADPLDCPPLTSPAEFSLETLFADPSHWLRAHADLSSLAPAFFSNPKPHGLFAPQLLLLSEAACSDKLLRKRAYNMVRAMFPFVALTTPTPPGYDCAAYAAACACHQKIELKCRSFRLALSISQN